MFSLIVTVKNEIKHLPEWLSSIKEQTLQPTEIIIVDGGSEDGTWQLLQKEAEQNELVKAYQEPGNIAHGRNYAIRKSTERIIVVTDAGCKYDKNWLKSIVKPFENKDIVWSATAFAPWLEEKDGLLIYSVAASTIPASKEFNRNWLPSSRSVAFHKDRWQTVGGYPEWIPFCEDVLLDLKLIRKDGQPFFVRERLVFWRPRSSLARYFKQLFNYTRSEGHGKINTSRQVTRYSVYLFSVAMLYLAFTRGIVYLLPLICGLLLYVQKFWKRYLEFTINKKNTFRFGGVLLVPFVVALGDVAKMSGYAFGSFERLTKANGIEYY